MTIIRCQDDDVVAAASRPRRVFCSGVSMASISAPRDSALIASIEEATGGRVDELKMQRVPSGLTKDLPWLCNEPWCVRSGVGQVITCGPIEVDLAALDHWRTAVKVAAGCPIARQCKDKPALELIQSAGAEYRRTRAVGVTDAGDGDTRDAGGDRRAQASTLTGRRGVGAPAERSSAALDSIARRAERHRSDKARTDSEVVPAFSRGQSATDACAIIVNFDGTSMIRFGIAPAATDT